MYQRYADGQSWKITHLSESAAENGGLKEAIVQVNLQIMFLLLLASSRFPVLGAEEAGMEAGRTSPALLLRIMAWHVLRLSYSWHCARLSSAGRRGKRWDASRYISLAFPCLLLTYRMILYLHVGSSQ